MGVPGYAGWVVKLDPAAIDSSRFELDINSNSTGILIGGTSSGTGPDWGQAAITAYESQQGQYGNTVSAFIYPNRTVTIPLLLASETAFSDLRMKVGLLQREGGSILRQRLGGDAMYADIVNASLTVPDVWLETGGVEPNVSLVLECSPDFYGDEIALDAITAVGYCDQLLKQDGETAVIQGDYPARCRLAVGNASASNQRGLLWGFRSRYYKSAASASLVQLAAAGTYLMPVAGFSSLVSGSQYYGGHAIQSAPTGGGLTVLMQLLNVTHVGTYAVYARVFPPSGAAVTLQMQAGVGNAPLNPPVTAPVPGGVGQIVNLGVVRIDPVPVTIGASGSWYAQVFASGPGIATGVACDVVWLQPLDESAGVGSGSDNVYFDLLIDGSVDIRTEGPYQLNADGSQNGTIVTYGDLPRLPPSGLEARPCELLVKPSLGGMPSNTDLDNTGDQNIDSFTAQVHYRPTWMFRP